MCGRGPRMICVHHSGILHFYSHKMHKRTKTKVPTPWCLEPPHDRSVVSCGIENPTPTSKSDFRQHQTSEGFPQNHSRLQIYCSSERVRNLHPQFWKTNCPVQQNLVTISVHNQFLNEILLGLRGCKLFLIHGDCPTNVLVCVQKFVCVAHRCCLGHQLGKNDLCQSGLVQIFEKLFPRVSTEIS